jgi:tRNA A-37 threonylcarbamoyl transferase component Bud32
VNPECPSEQVLLAFHQGTLPAGEVDAVADHLESCADCEAAAQRLDGSVDRVVAVVRKRAQSGSWTGSTWNRADPRWREVSDTDPSTWPKPPGYEVFGTLGRGGMGIVFKARHVRLNRLVALKQLRTNDAREAARARTEAEALARLRHDGIVQIYEVFEHAGVDYLALELVEGGSLRARLDGKPLPPAGAAELVEALARAAHYAHGHKIVHRDLKPANILLPPAAGPADGLGAPKIADFGVAKRLAASQGQTCDGDVLGTPAYMAPEQAAGRAVGPAADVYSLGVILYELLTGRVPLQGQTTYDTLILVRSQEPVAPRRLQPQVPRDLETVCLKCLEKEPGRRYASAQVLADDLRRFLNGESVLARPTSVWERGWKWAKRRPTVAALTAAVVLLAAVGVGSVTWQWLRAEDRAEAAVSATSRALGAEEDARGSLYRGLIAQARLEWRLNHADHADQLLALCEPERRG